MLKLFQLFEFPCSQLQVRHSLPKNVRKNVPQEQQQREQTILLDQF